MTRNSPWRVFWILFVAGIIGVGASLPFISELFFSNEKVRKAMPPLPVPILWFLVVAQFGVYLAILIPLSLVLAQRVGFKIPLVKAWVSGERPIAAWSVVLHGLVSGAAVGVVDVVIEFVVFFPHLPAALQTLSAGNIALWKRLLVGLFYGGIVEELFFRLFLLSLFAWLFSFVSHSADGRPSAPALWAANLVAALLFALGHLPATSTFAPLTALLVMRALVLNGVLGMTCGYLLWRRGLEAAILVHMGFHLVWQLPGVWIARASM